jgi:arylsulfatase A-like enzyme
MVVNIDFNPTLHDIAGVAIPVDVQGKSFLPLLAGSKYAKTKWRKSMYYRYYEYPQPHRVAPHIGIRTERYKLIRFDKPVVSWELYDLKKDPTEMHNMYKDDRHAKRIAYLKKALKQLALDYGDAEGASLVDE